MKISIIVQDATLEDMIIFEAICKPMIDEVLDECGFLKSNKVEKENE